MINMETYPKALKSIYSLQKFGIKLGINSTKNLLKRLGNPHLKVKCIHIAGTNGKGSVGAMLESTLTTAGINTGFYSSPHLINFSERFRFNGKEISEKKVFKLIKKVWGICDKKELPTFFEFVTTMAFLYFAEIKSQISIIETGLGGRLDATNVCLPLLTIITNIGLDHQEFLGETLEEIAQEKAGIIKKNIPIIHGIKEKKIYQIIEEKAISLNSPIIRIGHDIHVTQEKNNYFSLKGSSGKLKKLHTNLVGFHQSTNACLAFGALEELNKQNYNIKLDNFQKGISLVNWPGRLEKIFTLKNFSQIWLDGAHNIPAAKSLVENIPLIHNKKNPLIMVIGIMSDKDIESILKILMSPATFVILTQPNYFRAATTEKLASVASKISNHFSQEETLLNSIKKACAMLTTKGTILITGSLFTVGETKNLFEKKYFNNL